MSVRAIAQQLAIGSGTVVRALKNSTGQSDSTPSQLVAEPGVGLPKANSGNLEQQPVTSL
jgi:hypothetical protein